MAEMTTLEALKTVLQALREAKLDVTGDEAFAVTEAMAVVSGVIREMSLAKEAVSRDNTTNKEDPTSFKESRTKGEILGGK